MVYKREEKDPIWRKYNRGAHTQTHTHTHTGSGAQWAGQEKQETQSQSGSQDRKESQVEIHRAAHRPDPGKGRDRRGHRDSETFSQEDNIKATMVGGGRQGDTD